MAFGTAETAKLLVDLSLTGNFTSQLGKAQGALSKTAAQIDRTQSRAYRAGQQIGTGIKRGAVIAAAGVGFLASQVAFGVNSLIDLENQTTQTNAVLRSTKGAAGQTAASIRALAEKYESLNATIDDKVIQSGENVLLTFTNIRKQAFEPALKAALDLSVAMHQDLQPSIVQVGKALNDPIKGLTSLQRIGVSFNADQKKQIATLVKHNKLYEAQQIILKELNKEFGGSFLAGGQTTAGKIAKVGDAIEGLQQALARALLPAIGNVADALTAFLDDPAMIAAADRLGADIGKIFSKENIAKGFAFLKSILPVVKSAFSVVATLAQKAIDLWNKIPAPLQKALITGFIVNKLTGGLVTNTGGGILDSLFKGGAQGAASGIAGTVAKEFLNRGSPGNPMFTKEVGLPGGGPGGIGNLGAFTLIGTAIAASIISAIDRHDTFTAPLQNAGLTKAEIAATLASQRPDEAATILKRAGLTQQQAAEALKSAAAKLASFNPNPGMGLPELPGRTHATGTEAGNVEAHRGAIIARIDRDSIAALARASKPATPKDKPATPQDIEVLRGKIAEGLVQTGKQIDDIAPSINPKLLNLDRSVDTAGQVTAGAIRNKDLSIDQSIIIKVAVTAAAVTKSVTIQNRAGPGNGSAGGGRATVGTGPTSGSGV